MLQTLGYIFEITTTIAGILAAYFILKRNSSYIGNKLMATSMFAIGFYTFSIFIYDVIATEWAIEFFLPLAMISILFGTMLLYFSIQIMSHSSKWWEDWKNWIPQLVFGIGYGIYIYSTDFITIVDLTVVNVQVDLLSLIILVAAILSFIITSIFDLYLHGIRKSTGFSQKKMKIFEIGLIVNLIGIGINIVSQIITNQDVGAILDILFFMTLALGVILLSTGFLLHSNPTQKSQVPN